MLSIKIGVLSGICLLTGTVSIGQTTFPVNGLKDPRPITYAFINATIVPDTSGPVKNGIMLVREGKITALGTDLTVPSDAVVLDLHDRFIYPAFLEPYSDYGLPSSERPPRTNSPQPFSKLKGAFGWNDALHPEYSAAANYSIDDAKAISFRNGGFAAANIASQDGIARGTAAIVLFISQKAQESFVKERSATVFSFNKGSSTQDYPTSQMGAIALLRQTWYDAEWYANEGFKEETNLTLEAWNKNGDLPRVFDATNYLEALRAAKIGNEFGFKFIFKGAGDEYKRIADISNTKSKFIIPLKFPEALDVRDPYDAVNVSLESLRNFENAPSNPSRMYNARVIFSFTADQLKSPGDFLQSVRQAIQYGLPESYALAACTQVPAEMFGSGDELGFLKAGKIANFIVTSNALFADDTKILETWVAGNQFVVKTASDIHAAGTYQLETGTYQYQLSISGSAWSPKAQLKNDTSKTAVNISYENSMISISLSLPGKKKGETLVLSGYPVLNGYSGTGLSPDGSPLTWRLIKIDNNIIQDTTKKKSAQETPVTSAIKFPDKGFGFDTIPVARQVLFKNVTVWTNEDAGILDSTDVLISNGKITAIGKNLSERAAIVIDGTGKHLTPGIIDEHSHIAISGDVNECSHAITAEVRIGDVINPDDINIYRQLAGGVTTAHLLHGSCNPIGGQTALIKLRWGRNADELKYKDADGFIKFALGENVKQTNFGDNFRIRYPQTRMGVEQVYMDAFTNAHLYDQKMKSRKKGTVIRKILQLEALAEILNSKRFITCHSYQQGEINMLMHVADSFNFRINTFTHILEGYKVADKMKAHGVGASSFSDWWAYKYEVIEAIPYNGAILHDVGVITAYNSDDAEMARRLNQEAAKAVLYGGISEEEALKFVTLNPAKLLHIDDKVGSIKPGKDADVVLWTDNPLSIYSKVIQTYVDGVCYFDVARDQETQRQIQLERARLISKMNESAKAGGAKKPAYTESKLHHCIDETDN